MPESGEWFSPRTRPEMLTSDDPPVQDEKLDRLEILPGPATALGRVLAPFQHGLAFVPAIGRRIVRVDDEPSRWQLAGMWTTGTAIVAGAGLAVAAALGGAPAGITQQIDRLAVLPGLAGPQSADSDQAPAPAADKAKGDPATVRTNARTSSGSLSGSSRTSSYSGSGYSLVPGVPGGADLPDEVVVAAGGAPVAGAPRPGNPAPPAGGTTTTANPAPPATQNPAPPVETTDPAPPVETTDPAPPVDTTDPAPPVETTDPAPPVDTTDPAPPPDNPPTADPPQEDPTQADPAPDPPADPPADGAGTTDPAPAPTTP
ncbi:MAG TPA: hypothetical protein VGP36_04715 [Mycobacteriales bacterium]|jgi:hypothetical protein|nr:hypothetical protein [Mycobacteriales bacterium]